MNRQRLIGLFVDEARGLLSQAADQTVQLRSDPNSSSSLQALLRHCHSLKGMAATLGLDPYVLLAHRMEDLLQQLLNTPRLWSGRLMPILQAGVEQLQIWTDEVATGLPLTPAAAEILASIESHIDKSTLPERAPTSAREPESKQPQEFQIRLTLAASQRSPTERLLAALKRLSTVATIVRVRPPQLPIAAQAEPIHLRCEMRSMRDRESLLAEIESLPAVAFADVQPVAPIPELIRHGSPTTWTRVPLESLDAIAAGLRDLSGAVEDDPERARFLIRRLFGWVDELRLVPIVSMVHRLEPAVRDASRRLQRPVDFSFDGGEISVHRTLIDQLVEPLRHIVRNAIAHGIEEPASRREQGKPEAGCVNVRVERKRQRLQIEISDDGAGFDLERLHRLAVANGTVQADTPMSDRDLHRLALHCGLSTRDHADTVAGRGVGLDAAVKSLAELDASVEIASSRGRGSTISIDLPLPRSLVQALLFSRGETQYAVPLRSLRRAIPIEQRSEVSQIIEPSLDSAPQIEPNTLLVFQDQPTTLALAADEILGPKELWAQELFLPDELTAPYFGAARGDDGSLAVLLDPTRLTRN